jgi:hypothetical protein
MGVPWHAFLPEALLVRRIIEGLLPQASEEHAASGQFCFKAFHWNAD